MIKILSSGIGNSIQTLGRFDMASMGIPLGGAMDSISAKNSNRMLGNSENTPVIECMLNGPQIRFDVDALVGISGSERSVILDDLNLGPRSRISIRKGQVLSFRKEKKSGRYFYLAIKGGIATKMILNGHGDSPSAGIGRYIQKEDQFDICKHNMNNETPIVDVAHSENLKVFPGPEFYLLEQLGPGKLFTKRFTINSESNRMAFMFDGIEGPSHNHSMITSAVLPGTVQLTPSGKIVVLMRDAQLTGGYPRILQMSEISICALSQLSAGQEVRFTLNTL